MPACNNPIFFITGKVGAGKTTLLEKVFKSFPPRMVVGGFISRPFYDPASPEKSAASYEIEFIRTRKRFPWARRNFKNRNYDFNLESVPEIAAEFNKEMEICDILLFDELGKLELIKKEGLIGLFRAAVKNHSAILATVKKINLEDAATLVKEIRPGTIIRIIDLDLQSPEAALEKITLKTKDVTK